MVYAKVGISYTGTKQAWDNLSAENPGWDFDSVRGAAYDAWNARLNAIQVSGGSDAARPGGAAPPRSSMGAMGAAEGAGGRALASSSTRMV